MLATSFLVIACMQKEISKVDPNSSTRQACLQGCLGWCLGTWILLGFLPAFDDKRLALPQLCKQYGLCCTPAFLQGVPSWRLCQAEAACVTGPLHKTSDVASLMSSLSDNISTSSHMEKTLLEVLCVSIWLSWDSSPGNLCLGLPEGTLYSLFYCWVLQTFGLLLWVLILTRVAWVSS